MSCSRPLLLLDLGDCVGELVQIRADAGEQPRDAVPADAAVAILELGEVGHADPRALSELALGEPRLHAQLAKRGPEEAVITSCVVFGQRADHCNIGKHPLGCGKSNKWRPRCINTRAPGTGSSNSRRAGHATNLVHGPVLASGPPEPPTQEEPMSHIQITRWP